MSHEWHLGKLLGKGANGEAYEAFRKDVLTGEPDYDERFVIKKVGLPPRTSQQTTHGAR
jgi:hypothetical protein